MARLASRQLAVRVLPRERQPLLKLGVKGAFHLRPLTLQMLVSLALRAAAAPALLSDRLCEARSDARQLRSRLLRRRGATNLLQLTDLTLQPTKRHIHIIIVATAVDAERRDSGGSRVCRRSAERRRRCLAGRPRLSQRADALHQFVDALSR